MIKVPKCILKLEDDAAERRRRLAEALRNGQEISVTPAGTVMSKTDMDNNPAVDGIVVPEGKLAR